MKLLLWAAALSVLLPSAPLSGQEVRTASRAENARIRDMTNLGVWMGALVGEQGGAVIVGMPVRPVAGADLRGGDIIESVNGTRVATVAALNRAFDSVAAGRPVRLALGREGRSVVVTFSKPARVPRASVQTRRRDSGAAARPRR